MVSTAPVGADRIRPKPDETELFVEWQQLPTRTVGADRIRPQHKAPLRGACAGSTARRPLQGVLFILLYVLKSNLSY